MDNNNTNKKTNENNLFGVSYEEAKKNAENQKSDLEMYNFTSSSPDFNILYGYEAEKNEEDEKKNKKKSLGNLFGIGANEEKTDDLYKSSENILKDSNKNKGFFDIPLFSKKKNENDYEEMQGNNNFNNTQYNMNDINIENQKMKEDYERLKKLLEQQNELGFHENKLQDNIEGSQGLFHGVPRESDYGNHQNYKQNLGVSNFGGSQNNFSNEEVRGFNNTQNNNENKNNYNFNPQNNFSNEEVRNSNPSQNNNYNNNEFTHPIQEGNLEFYDDKFVNKNVADDFSITNSFNIDEIKMKNNQETNNFFEEPVKENKIENLYNEQEFQNKKSIEEINIIKEKEEPMTIQDLDFYEDDGISLGNVNSVEETLENPQNTDKGSLDTYEDNGETLESPNNKSAESLEELEIFNEPMKIEDLDLDIDFDLEQLNNPIYKEEKNISDLYNENKKIENIKQNINLDEFGINELKLELYGNDYEENKKESSFLEEENIYNKKVNEENKFENVLPENKKESSFLEEENIYNKKVNEENKIENVFPENKKEFSFLEEENIYNKKVNEENKFENVFPENKKEFSFLEEENIYNKKVNEENKFENVFPENKKEFSFLEEENIYNKKVNEENKFENAFPENKFEEKINIKENLNSDMEKLKEKINSRLYEQENFQTSILEKNHIFIEEVEEVEDIKEEKKIEPEIKIEELKIRNFENKIKEISTKKIKDLFVEDVELKYLILKEFTNKNLN